MDTHTTETTVCTELGNPLPLRGHFNQLLGEVQRIHFSLKPPRIVRVELRTEWQTLQLNGDSIEFDDASQCFQLRRRNAAGHARRG